MDAYEWDYVTCSRCGEEIAGCSNADIVNNLRIHFEEAHDDGSH
jgi:hypothetical protein